MSAARGVLAFLLTVSFAPLPARTATFVAGELADAADPTPGDGVCDADPVAAGEQCTLRAAVQTANELKGLDTVQLVAGTYALGLRGPGEDLAASDDLDVLDDLEVLGQGAGVTILDGRKLKHRIFDGFASLDLVGVTLERGKAGRGAESDRSGGCVRSRGGLAAINAVFSRCSARDDGGAIAVEAGSAFLQDTHLEANRAKDAGGALEIEGASAVFDRITASRNRARFGGAIAISGSSGTLSSSTLSGNKAREGGGLRNGESAALEIESSTLAFNKARVGRAIANSAATSLRNTIVHARKGAACAGSLVSEGGNLASDASCGFALPSDLVGVDPLLAELADNGGATPTHALGPGSPAVDAGLDDGCPLTDQRSQARVDIPDVGASVCDIGAFEATP
jgi:hypothetical protein